MLQQFPNSVTNNNPEVPGLSFGLLPPSSVENGNSDNLDQWNNWKPVQGNQNLNGNQQQQILNQGQNFENLQQPRGNQIPQNLADAQKLANKARQNSNQFGLGSVPRSPNNNQNGFASNGNANQFNSNQQDQDVQDIVPVPWIVETVNGIEDPAPLDSPPAEGKCKKSLSSQLYVS